ncbi:MAG: hypothetical protein ABI158_10295 [Edaphobacter sp.]
MRPLLSLSNAFVYFFGITPPDEKAAARVGWFIALMLVLMVAVVSGIGVLILHLTFPH